MKKSLSFCLIFAAGCAIASPGYIACPNSTNYIQTGDSMASVSSACGQPANTQAIKQPKQQTQKQVQWVYNYRQSNANQTTNQPGSNQPQYHNSMTVNFSPSNKVTSITVNGNPVQSTNYCDPSQNISIGTTNLVVRQLCGQASLIQTVNAKVSTATEKVVKWNYPGQGLSPSLQLTFINGNLTNIKQSMPSQ